MSAERKIQRAQSGAKQRRKSTSHLLEGSRSFSAGSLSSAASSSPGNNISNLKHLSESSRKESKSSLSRNSSSSSLIRQRKYSEVTPRYHDTSHGSPGLMTQMSLDSSGIAALSSPANASQTSLQSGNKDVMDYLFSTQREITIEEEQHSRIMHLYQVILLWKKRWKQMRDHNVLMAEKLETMEQEYRGVCESIKEIYENKLQKIKEDVRKATKSRDELVKEKRSLESSFKHMLEHSKMEKGEYEVRIMEQTNEIKALKDSLSDHAKKLEEMTEQIGEYVKKDVNNNEMSEHNKSLQEENKNLKNELKSLEIQLKEANLTYESHKLLLDTSLEKLKHLEHCVPKRYRTRKWRGYGGRYVMRVDQAEPIQMYVEDLAHSSHHTPDNQSVNSIDSLESIPEHLDDHVAMLNEGILATPAPNPDSYYNHVPPNYKEALKLSDSMNSAFSSGGRSSFPSNIDSTCSTPSVFSDIQSPPITITQASPENAKTQNSRKHLPLQKSFTVDNEITPMNSPASERSVIGTSPDSIDIKDAIHSVPDLRKFNQSLSPDTHVTHITQSASQLPTRDTAEYEHYTNHVRKGSMDADFLLSDTLKRKKKKAKSNHRRRGSLDFDMLTSGSQKTPKASRFDFLHKNKNGIVDDDGKGKGRKSKASEFADIFRKLTSSSSNLHDSEKKQNGFQKKRKSRSLKEKR